MSKKLGEGLTSEPQATIQLVEELQLVNRATVRSLRETASSGTQVELLLADPAMAATDPVRGVTLELHSTGALLQLDAPVGVGSFYTVRIDPTNADLAHERYLARCDRCTMLSEDDYEGRFYFLSSRPETDTD